MDAKELTDKIADECITYGMRGNQMRVYTTNDNGNLVAVNDVNITVMRDGGESTPIMVIKR